MATKTNGHVSSFRPGWRLTICTAVSAIILLVLGTWQLQRLGWKTALIQQIEDGLEKPAEQLLPNFDPQAITPFERIEIELSFDREAVWFLGTEVRSGEIGTTLLMGARDSEQRRWITELGWIPERRISNLAVEERQMPAAAHVTAVPRTPSQTNFATPQPDDETDRIYAEDSLIEGDFQSLILVIESGAPALASLGSDLVPPEVRPALRNNHLGYAITWYGLCAALIGVYFAFGRARAKAR